MIQTMFKKTPNIKVALIFSFVFLLAACSMRSDEHSNTLMPVGLKVGEGFINPLGYYEKAPRFSWKLPLHHKANWQKAYQVQVASSALDIEKADLWDSKKQASSSNAWIKYQGKPLLSRQQVFWRVRTWDEHDQVSRWSEIASIELGLLTNADWQAKWVRHPETGETDSFDFYHKKKKTVIKVKNKVYRPQYLRTVFNTTADASKKSERNQQDAITIKHARLYITAKGIFTAYINGHKVSDDVMTPGWTPYLKRIETLTYDVTSLLEKGDNVLAATVAEGWHTGRILMPRPLNVKPSALLAQLEIEYSDGRRQVVATDDTWQVTLNGPIRAAGNYDGEDYDARYAMPGWSTSNFTAKNWNTVITENIDPKVALSPKRHRASTVKLILPAVSIVDVANPKAGTVVFDMGQNMLGVPELSLPAIANQKITVRFAEALNKNIFYTDNLRSAKATDTYMPAKTGDIHYIPTFTFHGYRYVEISGFDTSKTPDLNWVKGRVLHSDFDVNANFKSSHAKLNKLAENIVWGLRGNFLDIPTDCPQRDERLGWTGDAQVFAAPSMYMADVYGFWAAWLQSVREEQTKNGGIPNFVPTKQHGFGKMASSGWGDVAVIVPWELYLLTGDIHILKDNYAMVKRWIAYHESQSQQYISSMRGFGDWLQPGAKKGKTPRYLISTAYFARSLDYAANMAVVLGYDNDARSYNALFDKVKRAFRDEYYDENTQVKSAMTQTSYLLPLAFNLFDEKDRLNAQEHLIDAIKSTDSHLGTGFIGTPLLAPVLQNMGRSDLMFDILFKETYPSWFYSINNGATTTWERWNSYSLADGFSQEKMNSLNHYAYGAVAKWFYEGILGIKPASAGFKTIDIAPQFTDRLDHASGSYKTPQGEVSVAWRIAQGKLDMQVIIPKNSRADFHLPQVKSLMINGIAAPKTKELNAPFLKGRLPGSYQITGFVDTSKQTAKVAPPSL